VIYALWLADTFSLHPGLVQLLLYFGRVLLPRCFQRAKGKLPVRLTLKVGKASDPTTMDSFVPTYHPQSTVAQKVPRDQFGDPQISWFQRELNGTETSTYLNNAAAGAFLVRRPPETMANIGLQDLCLSIQAGPQIANVLLKSVPGPDTGSIQAVDAYFMFNPLHMFADIVDLIEYASKHPFNFPTLASSVHITLNSKAAGDAEKENAKREKQEAKDAKKAEAERVKEDKKS